MLVALVLEEEFMVLVIVQVFAHEVAHLLEKPGYFLIGQARDEAFEKIVV
jgi:hypothetical protein